MDLKVVIEQLSKLIDPQEEIINVTNIATLNDGDDFLESKSPIILSIVNIEEDKTQKNQSVYLGLADDQNISRYNQPTQHLIISLLFSSYNKDLSKYLDGIDKLKTIVQYFQQNKSFYYKNDDSELLDYASFLAKNEVAQQDYYKITMEFVSLSMEQLNQMWSYLGSKYMPSALYKMRLFMIQNETTIEEKVIKKVKINLWENDKNNPIGLLETGEFEN
ncbi:Pvc16 family protein [Flavobacterium sp. HNIBRBA15423]|uniref:Pvc16 family protein n=1 Tax=Flavobacterium sp. HNIBRBA15423 TaxID=3458683 RepID=UPI0040445C2D